MVKTFMAKKEAVERKWYVVDAAGKPLGRVASQVASVLRGKNKPTFTPHVDTGDFVIVINCDKVVLTGKKLDQKMYVRRSPRPGHLKQTKYGKLMAERSDFAMMKAVKGMLPTTVSAEKCSRSFAFTRARNTSTRLNSPKCWRWTKEGMNNGKS